MTAPGARLRQARRASTQAHVDGRVPGADAAGVRLALLGAFELTRDGRPVALPMTAQRVLAFLALHDRPLRRSYVAGTLWLESSEDRALANLRSALWRVHQSDCLLIEAASRHLRLADTVRVDVREATASARRVLDGSSGHESADPRDLGLVARLLPDWYDDWVLIERERLRQLALHALDCLCDRLTEAGKFGQALDAALAAVAGEPLRESAHRALIRLHLAEGNTGEAIRHYRFYRKLLHDQLGLAPSPQLDELLDGLTQ